MQSEIAVITETLGAVGNPKAILSPIGLSKPGVPEHPQAAKPRVRKQILRMIVIMAAVAIAVGAISIWLLYSAALNEKRTDLIQIVQSQARLISAVARFDAEHSRNDHPGGSAAATLSQVIDAHERISGFGETGEFILARRQGDNIVFLLRHRRFDRDPPQPVAWSAAAAEPMRRALQGVTGTLIGPDYRGATVLAGHVPVAELNIGLVAKIDLAELRRPFVNAGMASAGGAIIIIVLGTAIFRRVSAPLLEREGAEQALQDSEERVRAQFENNPVPVFLWQRSGDDFVLIDSNKTAIERNHGRINEFIGKRASEVFSPWQDGLHSLHRSFTDKTVIKDTSLRKKLSSDEIRWIESTFIFIPPDRVMLHSMDIDEHKRAEHALRNSEARNRGILENVVDGIATIDEHGIIQTFNPAAERIFGYDASEVVGRNVNVLMPDPDKRLHDRYLKNHLDSGQGKIFGCGAREVTALRKDGSKISLELAVGVMTTEGARSFIGTMRDISDRKKVEEEKSALESQLRQAHKMESLGNMAGGTAHEFNNLLLPITGLTELAMREIPADGLAYKNLSHVLHSARRAGKLVDKILAFSRADNLDLKTLPLMPIITESIELISAILPSTITIQTSLEDVGAIVGDETQIHQVVLNLAKNAADAMGERVGQLTIELAAKLIYRPRNIRLGIIPPGEYARLSVQDTGCGMTEETMNRIFEPFFTTKEIGRGTGLGLAVIHGFIASHGGAIDVESELGRGTTFHIYLPLSKRPNETATAEK